MLRGLGCLLRCCRVFRGAVVELSRCPLHCRHVLKLSDCKCYDRASTLQISEQKGGGTRAAGAHHG